MVGYDDDQRAFGCAAFQERELGVDMFECGHPVFGIPPVIVADFVGVTDVQVGQAGGAGGACGGQHTIAWGDVALIVGASQCGFGQWRFGELGQPRARDAHLLSRKFLEHRLLALQVERIDHGRHRNVRIGWFGCQRVFELDELDELMAGGFELRIARHCGQSRAGSGTECGHGRHSGAWSAGGDGTLIGGFVHQRTQIGRVAEAHGEVPEAQAVHEHHDGRFGVGQSQRALAGLGIGVDLGGSRMPNRGGQGGQHGGQVQCSPTPIGRGVIPIAHSGHQPQQLVHIRRLNTHSCPFK